MYVLFLKNAPRQSCRVCLIQRQNSRYFRRPIWKTKSWYKSKPTRKLQHANSILEYFEYFCQMSSKSILIILSYTVSNFARFLKHSVYYRAVFGRKRLKREIMLHVTNVTKFTDLTLLPLLYNASNELDQRFSALSIWQLQAVEHASSYRSNGDWT